MKVYKNPKRYQFQFDDHSFASGQPLELKDLQRLTDIPIIRIDLTGWIVAENKKAYMVATTMLSHHDGPQFDDIWVLLKVKELTKVKCND